MSTPTLTSLAQVTVQVDALSVIKDVEEGLVEAEDFWVSCYETGKPSVHGKVRVTIDEDVRDQCAFRGRDGIECKQVAKNTFHISCPSLHIHTRTIRFPSRTLTLPALPTTTKNPSKLDYGITSLDVSPDSGRTWVAGLGNGSIVLGKKGETPTVLGTVHKAAVSGVQFVEGGNILSASEDFTLSLTSLSSPTPTPPLRLTSHTRAITSLSLIPNIPNQAISASKDGTLRIWDISPGTGRQLGMLRSSGDVPITALSVSSSGTVVAMALQSGYFDLVDLETRLTIFSSSSLASTKTYGALDAIALYTYPESGGRHLVVTGSRNGVISFYNCSIRDGGVDVRQLGSCVRNGAGVSDIKLIPPSSDIATADGLPYHLQLTYPPNSDTLEFQVVAEYTGGPDCSPVRTIVGCMESEEVWMAGDDGVIWVYKI
ncbi:hypothetical protein FRC09_006218 [Ceratobasidium sp. 395]|nr:hypothetical protein FRC09_006218 [Ceratobasidium sp. 395]